MSQPVLVLALVCSVAVGQVPSTTKSAAATGPAVKQVGRLGDDAAWRDAAARLVLMRHQAAVPLAQALSAAAKREDNKLAGRILAVLDRMGMDAGAATEALWAAMEHLNADNAAAALRAAPRIRDVGGDNPSVRITGVRAWLADRGSTPFSRRVRRYTGTCLRRLRCKYQLKANASIEQLVADLREPRREASFAVVQLLGARGKAAKAALPELARLLTAAQRRTLRVHPGQDPAEYARDLADAILRVDPLSKQAALAYGYLLTRERFRALRLRAAREVMMLGPHVEGAGPFLLEFLRREQGDPDLVCTVINGITMLGWKAEWAIPSLEKLANGDHPKIARRAGSALKRIRSAKKRR